MTRTQKERARLNKGLEKGEVDWHNIDFKNGKELRFEPVERDRLDTVIPQTPFASLAMGLDTINNQAPFWLSLFRQGSIADFKQNAIPYDKYGNAAPVKFHPCENPGCVEMAAQVGNGHGRIPGQERVYTDYGYYKIAPDIVEEWGIALPPVPDAKLWDRQMSNQYWDRIKKDFPIFNTSPQH
jgi:hypothetical protein